MAFGGIELTSHNARTMLAHNARTMLAQCSSIIPSCEYRPGEYVSLASFQWQGMRQCHHLICKQTWELIFSGNVYIINITVVLAQRPEGYLC